MRDQPVDSPEYKALKREERKQQNELGRELVKREKIVDKLAVTNAEILELRVRRNRLDDRIPPHHDRIRIALYAPPLGP